MNKIVHLSLTNKSVPARFDVVQYATKPAITFVLDDYIPSGTASLYIQKPDGTEIYNACTISGNEVTYQPTTQSFAAVGINKGQLQIVEPNGTAVSFVMFIDVSENIIDSSAIESQDEFTALEEALQSLDGVVMHNDTNGPVSLNGNLTIKKVEPTINFTNSEQGNANSRITAYPINNLGNNLVINAGGNLITGGGEYALNRYSATLTESTQEDAYYGADGNVYIESNGQTIENAYKWTFGKNGHLTLPKNDSYIVAIDKDGNAVNNMLDLLNTSNNTTLAYGSFANGLGETNIYAGNRINLFSKDAVTIWTRRGESDQKGWLFNTAGNIVTPAGTELVLGGSAITETQIWGNTTNKVAISVTNTVDNKRFALLSKTDRLQLYNYTDAQTTWDIFPPTVIATGGNMGQESVSVPNAAWTEVGSYTFAPGKYLVACYVAFNNNSTGMRRIGLNTASAAEGGSWGWNDSENAVNGAPTSMQVQGVLNVTSSRTYYLNAYQNSGGALSCNPRWHCVKIG